MADKKVDEIARVPLNESVCLRFASSNAWRYMTQVNLLINTV